MPGSRLNVHLYRDSFNTPWGFRLQGGKDLSQPLTVQRVFSNSPAEGELQRGDVILSINNRDAAQLTHKQAQDLIKHGGGQVQLVISRPPPGAHIGPLSPPIITQKPRAPSLQSPEGRESTVRYLTVQMAESNPSYKYVDYSPKQLLSPPYLSPQHKQTYETQPFASFERQRSSYSQPPTSPVPTSSVPSWVTQQLAAKKKSKLAKLGGGGQYFGTTYNSYATLPRGSSSQPVGSSSPGSYGFHPTKVTLNKYGGSGPQFGSDFSSKGYVPDKSGMLNRLQSSLDTLTLSPRSPEVYTSSPFYQAYEPPSHFPQKIYTPTGLLLEQQRLEQEAENEGEVIAPVWERRRHFQQAPVQSSQVRAPTKKPAAKFSKPRQVAPGIADLGLDYSIPSGKQAGGAWRPAPHFNQGHGHNKPKPAAQPYTPVHSTPPSWQREEEKDTGTPAWRSSLKSSGVKPWEMDESFQNVQQPTRSVPYQPTPAKSQYSHGPFSPTGAHQTGGSEDGPKVVHLQYNSPLHLYSNQNVAETLKGQTQAIAGQKPPPPIITESGERDWSQSAVLRFITQEDSRKVKHPPPPVSPKPIFSSVQAPRSPQAFYEDSSISQF